MNLQSSVQVANAGSLDSVQSIVSMVGGMFGMNGNMNLPEAVGNNGLATNMWGLGNAMLARRRPWLALGSEFLRERHISNKNARATAPSLSSSGVNINDRGPAPATPAKAPAIAKPSSNLIH